MDLLVHCITCVTHALAEISNKFLASLPRKVWFGVRIDILEKEKFSNLSKKFIFLFSFISCLYFAYFIFFLFFCIFLLGAEYNV